MQLHELIELKEEIRKNDQEHEQLKGTEKHLVKQLKADWKVSTLKKAKLKRQEFTNELARLDRLIEKGMQKVERERDEHT